MSKAKLASTHKTYAFEKINIKKGLGSARSQYNSTFNLSEFNTCGVHCIDIVAPTYLLVRESAEVKPHANYRIESQHGDLDIIRSDLQSVHYIVDERQSLLEVCFAHRPRLVQDEHDVCEVIFTFPGLGVREVGIGERRKRIKI